jgi:hypothetical protein
MHEQNKTNARKLSQLRGFATAGLPDEKIEAIAKSKMDSRHDHLNALLEVNSS